MTRDGWAEVVLNAAEKHCDGDDSALNLLAKLLEEVDDAKQRLREIGFGVTGTPWPDIIEQIADLVDCQP